MEDREGRRHRRQSHLRTAAAGRPLFKFTLTIVKGRLQGDMAGERDGVVRGHAKVDAAKAK